MRICVSFLLLSLSLAIDIKDAHHHMRLHAESLRSFYDVVDRQSRLLNFVRLRGLCVASYDFYRGLDARSRSKYCIQLVLVNAVIRGIHSISDLEGVSVTIVPKSELGSDRERATFVKFGRVYYTDLLHIGIGQDIYAYCTVPYLTNCIPLGIGQRW